MAKSYISLIYSREFGIKFWNEFDRPFNPMFNGELLSLVNNFIVC